MWDNHIVASVDLLICCLHTVMSLTNPRAGQIMYCMIRNACFATQALVTGADGLALRSGAEGDAELRRDGMERDERRLGELGRRTVEMFAIAHIFSERLEVCVCD